MTFQIGSISEGTLRPENLLPTFASELRSRATNEELAFYKEILDEAYKMGDFSTKDATWLLDSLEAGLMQIYPLGLHFCSVEGDGACFGFWPDQDILDNPEDHDVLKLNAGDSSPTDYRGDLFFVSDHGNISFGYVDSEGFHETWSCV